MGRKPGRSKDDINRGAWTAVEDKILGSYVKAHGEGKWSSLPRRAGLKRCGKSCRLRWLNYLRPDIKRGSISDDEEDLIIRLHKLLGNRWSLIAGRLPGRTDNEIKNYWNTTLSKKLNNARAKANKPMSAPHLDESNVIRSKASSCCTKPFDVPLRMTQPPPPQPPPVPRSLHADQEARVDGPKDESATHEEDLGFDIDKEGLCMMQDSGFHGAIFDVARGGGVVDEVCDALDESLLGVDDLPLPSLLLPEGDFSFDASTLDEWLRDDPDGDFLQTTSE